METTKIKQVYFKYLFAAFGSAMISSIYSIVDMAMVGQYQGPEGTAALAIVAPVWNIIYSLGLMMGIGGSVIFSIARGEKNKQRANEFFTTALIGTIILALLSWFALWFFEDQMLYLFGAEASLLPLAKAYLMPVKFVVPVFLFNQMLAAFLRNDNNPTLATIAVLTGGIFNVFGDYFFVFTLDMGITGAGLATAMGAVITLAVSLTHFRSSKNGLCLVKVTSLLTKMKRIVVTGFSTFFVDLAMGILTMLFNRQIVKYLGTDALSVYGVIVNISTIVQCCGYSVGQAAQPIISYNFGAKNSVNIKATLKYAILTAIFFGIGWTALMYLCPNLLISIFMKPTVNILTIAPKIMQTYGLSFVLLPINIFSTYYFQSLMKAGTSLMISVLRGLVISGTLIYFLPLLFEANSIWLAMLFTEIIVMIIVVYFIRRYTKALN
ncbi:MAG: MATE family efflux transporter [Thomasclavelia sp.]